MCKICLCRYLKTTRVLKLNKIGWQYTFRLGILIYMTLDLERKTTVNNVFGVLVSLPVHRMSFEHWHLNSLLSSDYVLSFEWNFGRKHFKSISLFRSLTCFYTFWNRLIEGACAFPGPSRVGHKNSDGEKFSFRVRIDCIFVFCIIFFLTHTAPVSLLGFLDRMSNTTV